jgi:hypothetical protein
MKTKIILFGILLIVVSKLQSQSSLNGNFTGQTGFNTTSLGWNALDFNGGFYNTAVGHWAARWGAWDNECTAVGSSALYWSGQTFPPSGSLDYCTAIGFSSLYTNVWGHDNTSAGSESMYFNNNGSYNNATGYRALYNNTDGNGNTANGAYALFNNNMIGAAIGEYNTAFGHSALISNVGGGNNIAIGGQALNSNYSGSNNVAIGFQTLLSNTIGNDNVAVGYQSMYFNTTGYENTATGIGALTNNISGIKNAAFGSYAMNHNQHGILNTAFGTNAMFANTNGQSNVAIGYNALYGNPFIANNANGNVAVGENAMVNVSSNSSSFNTAVGCNALTYAWGPGTGVTTIGAYADESGNFSNATAFGFGAVVNANNKVRLGNSSVLVVEGSPLGWSNYSDGRFKSNVEENVKGLEFIKHLRPVVYNFDTKKFQEFLIQDFADSVKKIHLSLNFEEGTKQRRTGFIAQEAEMAANESGYDFNGIHKPQDEKDNYSLAYGLFVVPLVKAVKEQQEIIEEQDSTIEKLISESKQLESELNRINAQKLESTQVLTEVMMIANFSMGAKPNPFSTETMIYYTLPHDLLEARLIISTLNGKEVFSQQINGQKGYSELKISSEGLDAGIYFYSIVSQNETLGSKRLIIANK